MGPLEIHSAVQGGRKVEGCGGWEGGYGGWGRGYGGWVVEVCRTQTTGACKRRRWQKEKEKKREKQISVMEMNSEMKIMN